MVKKEIKDIQDEDILAKPIMTWDYQIILQKGAYLKKEYIERLEELGIQEIYVEKKNICSDKNVEFKMELEHSIKEKVKNILERHTYQNNDDLTEIVQTADHIISNILEEEKVLEKVLDIKERNNDLYEHSICICSLSILTSLKLGVEIEKIHDIGVGCLLHDLGLRYSSIDFININVDELKDVELAEYKKHTVNAYSSLKEEKWISNLSKKIILYHHERLDGSGFPLRTKEIPFECGIVSVCDAFDEIICGISRKKMKVYEAIEYLKAYKGIYFYGKIVEAFLEFVAVYPAGTKVMTNEGEIAIIVSQNKGFQDRPVIRILKDKYGKTVEGEILKNLVKIHNVFIEDVVD